MAVNLVLDKMLDKAWKDKPLEEILAAPPSALTGLTEKHDAQLLEALKIKTLADLGNNKYIQFAVALAKIGEQAG